MYNVRWRQLSEWYYITKLWINKDQIRVTELVYPSFLFRNIDYVTIPWMHSDQLCLGCMPLFPVWNSECADCVTSVDMCTFHYLCAKTYEHVTIKDSAHVNFPFEIQTSKDSSQTYITKCIKIIMLFVQIREKTCFKICRELVKINILNFSFLTHLIFNEFNMDHALYLNPCFLTLCGYWCIFQEPLQWPCKFIAKEAFGSET